MKRRLVGAAPPSSPRFPLSVAAGCGSDGGTTTTTVTVTVTTTVPATPATPTGPPVAELQRVMTRLGFYSGPIGGIYGDATTAGVKEMQTDLNVTSDGVYGPETNAALRNKGHFVVTEMQTRRWPGTGTTPGRSTAPTAPRRRRRSRSSKPTSASRSTAASARRPRRRSTKPSRAAG